MQNACNDIVRKNQSNCSDSVKTKNLRVKWIDTKKGKKKLYVYTTQTHTHRRMDGRTKEELSNGHSVKCGANHRKRYD